MRLTRAGAAQMPSGGRTNRSAKARPTAACGFSMPGVSHAAPRPGSALPFSYDHNYAELRGLRRPARIDNGGRTTRDGMRDGLWGARRRVVARVPEDGREGGAMLLARFPNPPT